MNESRIAALRPGASDALVLVLDEAQRELEIWREVRTETGYVQLVIRTSDRRPT